MGNKDSEHSGKQYDTTIKLTDKETEILVIQSNDYCGKKKKG